MLKRCKQPLKNAHLILNSLVALFQWVKCNAVADLLFILVITGWLFPGLKELVASNQLLKELLLFFF